MLKHRFDDDAALAKRGNKRRKTWEDADGVRYDILEIRMQASPEQLEKYKKFIRVQWRCGYATFPVRPLASLGYGGLVGEVRVHGGVTYAEPALRDVHNGAYTYGFDCNHSADIGRVFTLAYIRNELESMVRQLWVLVEPSVLYVARLEELGQNEDVLYTDPVLNFIREGAHRLLNTARRR